MISPSLSPSAPSSSPISTSVSSSASLKRARVRRCTGVTKPATNVLAFSSTRPTRSSSGIDACKVNAPMADNRYAAESASTFGIKSQGTTTTAKMTIAASHNGRGVGNGPRQSRNRQSKTKGTLTALSPSSSTFRTRRGLARKISMNFMSAGWFASKRRN